MESQIPFWKTKKLSQLTPDEWEALCDGCGLCCLHKVQYEESGYIAITDLACKMLDIDNCTCKDYANRRKHVPDCIRLSPDTVEQYQWLPDSCAYRRVAENRDLPDWHYLKCGDRNEVHRQGASAQGKAKSEGSVRNPKAYVYNWRPR